MSKKECKNCKWYEEFDGVCCNVDSEHRADFRNHDDVCEKWKKEGKK